MFNLRAYMKNLHLKKMEHIYRRYENEEAIPLYERYGFYIGNYTLKMV